MSRVCRDIFSSCWQVLGAIGFLHQQRLNFHPLDSDSVLVWALDTMQVKLSDKGITHQPSSCEVWLVPMSVPCHNC